jgi:hypothetical protein
MHRKRARGGRRRLAAAGSFNFAFSSLADDVAFVRSAGGYDHASCSKSRFGLGGKTDPVYAH